MCIPTPTNPIGAGSTLPRPHGVTYRIAGSPGTIDADYRGEIRVILVNLGQEAVQIVSGDRIAQMVIARYETADWHEVDTLSESERGEGGFGHTGMQVKK